MISSSTSVFVYPLAIRDPDFFEKNHPNWLAYTFRDIFRVAQFMDIPMAPPNPDPIVQDIATRKIAEDQPHIFLLTRMGQAASRRGKGWNLPMKSRVLSGAGRRVGMRAIIWSRLPRAQGLIWPS